MNDLDEVERRAYEMVRFLQDECRKQCKPYLKILADIHSLRPQVYVVDGKTMMPVAPDWGARVGAFLRPTDSASEPARCSCNMDDCLACERQRAAG